VKALEAYVQKSGSHILGRDTSAHRQNWLGVHHPCKVSAMCIQDIGSLSEAPVSFGLLEKGGCQLLGIKPFWLLLII